MQNLGGLRVFNDDNKPKVTKEVLASMAKAHDSFGALREAIGRADALTASAENMHDQAPWPQDVDQVHVERLKHLHSLSREAIEEARLALDRFSTDMSDLNIGWTEGL